MSILTCVNSHGICTEQTADTARAHEVETHRRELEHAAEKAHARERKARTQSTLKTLCTAQVHREVSCTHTRTHTHTHRQTHAHTDAHAHTHVYRSLLVCSGLFWCIQVSLGVFRSLLRLCISLLWHTQSNSCTQSTLRSLCAAQITSLDFLYSFLLVYVRLFWFISVSFDMMYSIRSTGHLVRSLL